MTAPATKAPAKKATDKAPTLNKDGSVRKARTALPALSVDLSKVTPKSGDDITYSRSSALDGTPVMAWVKASRAEGVAADKEGVRKDVPVALKEAEAATLESLLRAAAAKQGIGIKVVFSEPDKDGNVIVSYQAKNKKKHTPKPKPATA